MLRYKILRKRVQSPLNCSSKSIKFIMVLKPNAKWPCSIVILIENAGGNLGKKKVFFDILKDVVWEMRGMNEVVSIRWP